MKRLLETLVIVFAILCGIGLGFITGLTVKLETRPEKECIDIPEDRIIVITRSETLIDNLKEKE